MPCAQRVMTRDQLLSMSRRHEVLIVTERGAGYRLASDVETLY
jgi:DNA-binding response OmpR family regulator